MNYSNNTADSEQPTNQQRNEQESTTECVICDLTLLEKDTVISYHPSDDPEPSFVSGYLCPICQMRIENVFNGKQVDECEKCGVPFTESHRMDVWEHDINGCLQRVSNLCFDCLAQY